ncbi:hypothetical protein LNAT_P1633 [Lebetimonas natsushimae]|uniref:Uncharacterized protein n=1 Tax=Lebetimonas natsushimae TaxID=1936991 RepID=A0A292YEU7_9BACT|nr:hypothetical protein [Lebetimonas natsushimae]GAX88337.1 hypothetical protein LNAT_P1633 [Lebetimonas natsushimae]
MKFFLIMFIFLFLNAKYFEFNSKKYEYRVITAYDEICDKKIKTKSYICCGMRFYRFKDMVSFIKTGKYFSPSPYDINQIVKECRLKELREKEKFQKALKEGDFETAKKIYEKSHIKSVLKSIVMDMNITSCKLKFLKPDLIDLANSKRYKFFDCFVKDKKAFAKKHWKNLDRDFFKHYKITLWDMFSKKEIDSFEEFTLEGLLEKFDNEYLKGKLCLMYIYWRNLEDLKRHLDYCKYLPKNSLYYKVIFEKEKAKKELEKVKYNHSISSDNFNLGAILINLYLIDNDEKNAKRVYLKMLNKCNNLIDAINSKIIISIFGPFFGINPSTYTLKKDCIKVIDNDIYMEYEWISLFYDYELKDSKKLGIK